MMSAKVLDLGQGVLLPPPPASPVPLPRKRERIDVGTASPRGILSRLRGRGTTRSVVEGGAASAGPAYLAIQIPLRGSFVLRP